LGHPRGRSVDSTGGRFAGVRPLFKQSPKSLDADLFE